MSSIRTSLSLAALLAGTFVQAPQVHRTASGGTVFSQHDYTYGSGVEVGQIKTWQRQLPNSGGGSTTTTQTFGYDNILQLTSAAETGQSTKTYAYDAAGNRTSKSESGSSTTYATANDSNEIILFLM